ncbi:hypothetical protein MAXJ12_19003, partial [Mesorhizobium alhagi CCNWXJ12-2]
LNQQVAVIANTTRQFFKRLDKMMLAESGMGRLCVSG